MKMNPFALALAGTAALSAPRRWPLAWRIVALFLGLLLAVQGASLVAVHMRTDAEARGAIEQQLATGERALAELRAQNMRRLHDAAVMLSRDHGFLTTIAGDRTRVPRCGQAICGDAQSIGDALNAVGTRVGASLTALYDPKLQRRGGADVQALHTLMPWLAEGDGDAVVVIDGRATQIVVAPLNTPQTIGHVAMGFALDSALAERLTRITGQQVAVVTRANPTQPWAIQVSTLSWAQTSELQAVLGTHDRASGELELDGDRFLARGLSLSTGAAGQAQAVLMLSVDEALAPTRRLQRDLAVITLIGVLGFGVGALASARRVTTPIRQLAAAADQLGRGDYDTPMRDVHRGDEVGELAQRFEAMRINVAAKSAEIRAQAFIDPRTGLPNRLHFDEALAAAIARPGQRRGAVLWLDLERFKRVNDLLGHAEGDRLLEAVAERLRAEQRESDLVARVGGDEFALLVAGADARSALLVAQRIAAAFDAPLVLHEQPVDVPVRIGVACWPDHGTDASTLVSRAELAMYAAKRAAAGPQLYDPAQDNASGQNLTLLSELRRAVEHGELRLYLQPKVALSDGRLVGAEALVRWQHPERGLVPPLQFIPYAESSGFIRQLTLWVAGEAARLWACMAADGSGDLRISINLSARDLFDQELPNKLDLAFARHAAPPGAFCLEITESAIMDDPARAQSTLRELAARGYRLSIDDFGTGQSSLAYLATLPVHELKVDQAFVRRMDEDEKAATLVRMAIDLAHNLGLSAVAEGVETARIWNQLHRLDCDEAQGFHMSKPVPVDQFNAWRVRWSERVATGWMGLELH
jgi:diguanylate cyclase (GGDEF)-like protein